MNEKKAEERLAEIAVLLRERELKFKVLQSLDKKIAQLAGAEQEQRKSKTFSPHDFARGCGV